MAATLFKAASEPGLLFGDSPGGPPIEGVEGVGADGDGAFGEGEGVGGAGGEMVGAPDGGVEMVGAGVEGGGETVGEGVGDEVWVGGGAAIGGVEAGGDLVGEAVGAALGPWAKAELATKATSIKPTKLE